jgi:hypothetical protein
MSKGLLAKGDWHEGGVLGDPKDLDHSATATIL